MTTEVDATIYAVLKYLSYIAEGFRKNVGAPKWIQEVNMKIIGEENMGLVPEEHEMKFPRVSAFVQFLQRPQQLT